MKKIELISKLIAVFVIFFLASCSQDDEPTEEVVTEVESAEDIGATLADDLVPVVEDANDLSVKASSDGRTYEVKACGVDYDTTFSRSYSGVYVTSQATFTYAYQLVCNGAIPSTLNLEAASSGTRTTERLTSQGSITSELIVTGVQPSSTSFVVNGELSRTGSVTGENKSFNSTSQLTITDLTLTKSTQQIASGTATVTYAGSTSAGNSVSRTASVTFLGGNEAELTLNSGRKFLVNLRTGEVTEIED